MAACLHLRVEKRRDEGLGDCSGVLQPRARALVLPLANLNGEQNSRSPWQMPATSLLTMPSRNTSAQYHTNRTLDITPYKTLIKVASPILQLRTLPLSDLLRYHTQATFFSEYGPGYNIDLFTPYYERVTTKTGSSAHGKGAWRFISAGTTSTANPLRCSRQ
jgi:hypothetical protein